MSASYQLTVSITFSAAHKLRDYVGKCARVHGHNYRVEVTIESTQLDKAGLAIDYLEIKKHLQQSVDKLDHYYINEIPPFDKTNPSAENIAAWFYERMEQALNEYQHIKLVAVTLWETEHFSVRHTKC